MTVVSAAPDREARTVTVVAQYDAPVDRVWQLWADPRLLERWWGPPTFPAVVHDHELTAGGKVTYVMTGTEEGDRHPGWWRIRSVDARHGLEFDDGFGEPFSEDMPVSRSAVQLTADGAGTRMVVTTSFASLEDLDQLLEMGMLDGMSQALAQTDDLLLERADR